MTIHFTTQQQRKHWREKQQVPITANIQEDMSTVM